MHIVKSQACVLFSLSLLGISWLLDLTLVVTLGWSPAGAQDYPYCAHTTLSVKSVIFSMK